MNFLLKKTVLLPVIVFLLVLVLIFSFLKDSADEKDLLGEAVESIPQGTALALSVGPSMREVQSTGKSSYILFLDKDGHVLGHKKLEKTSSPRIIPYNDALIFSDRSNTYSMDYSGIHSHPKKIEDSLQQGSYISDLGVVTWYNHGLDDSLGGYAHSYSLYSSTGELYSGAEKGHLSARGTCYGKPAALFSDSVGTEEKRWSLRVFDEDEGQFLVKKEWVLPGQEQPLSGGIKELCDNSGIIFPYSLEITRPKADELQELKTGEYLGIMRVEHDGSIRRYRGEWYDPYDFPTPRSGFSVKRIEEETGHTVGFSWAASSYGKERLSHVICKISVENLSCTDQEPLPEEESGQWKLTENDPGVIVDSGEEYDTFAYGEQEVRTTILQELADQEPRGQYGHYNVKHAVFVSLPLRTPQN